ncbi:MAG: malate dehydrogenase [Chloroflexi bacterium HGW-Chloroflexi-9]|nr:MAG: malate dehydrogenase [Chloroflexi bacterium HGW-Chloroflexi-9]
MRQKVTIVGAGNTGATMAQILAARGYADVVLIDIVEGLPQGKALDIAEAAPWSRTSSSLLGTNNWDDTANSDVVVITSGVARKPGMTREDLLSVNAGIVRSVVGQAAKQSPNAVLVIFANPMDAMCHVALEASGFPKERVVGQGGMLDTARYRTFIAMETGTSVKDVSAWVLGGHTEATMVPLSSNATVGGVPLTQLLPAAQVEAVVNRAKRGGAEIVDLLKTGSAFVAPAVATIEMVDAILLDERRILPCCTLLDGQWGITDAYVGAPVVLGKGGIQYVYEIPVSDAERDAIRAAGDAVKELVAATPR